MVVLLLVGIYPQTKADSLLQTTLIVWFFLSLRDTFGLDRSVRHPPLPVPLRQPTFGHEYPLRIQTRVGQTPNFQATAWWFGFGFEAFGNLPAGCLWEPTENRPPNHQSKPPIGGRVTIFGLVWPLGQLANGFFGTRARELWGCDHGVEPQIQSGLVGLGGGSVYGLRRDGWSSNWAVRQRCQAYLAHFQLLGQSHWPHRGLG